jgi:GxxExxY protein
MKSEERDALTEKIIGLAIEVHRHLGPGLLESAYEKCLAHESEEAGFQVERQVALSVAYKKIKLQRAYRIDLLVEGSVILEIKTVDKIIPVHEAQLLTYLKLSGVHTGLLLNFQVPVLKEGIKRLVN